MDDDDVIDVMIRYRIPESVARDVLAKQLRTSVGDTFVRDEITLAVEPAKAQVTLKETLDGISTLEYGGVESGSGAETR